MFFIFNLMYDLTNCLVKTRWALSHTSCTIGNDLFHTRISNLYCVFELSLWLFFHSRNFSLRWEFFFNFTIYCLSGLYFFILPVTRPCSLVAGRKLLVTKGTNVLLYVPVKLSSIQGRAGETYFVHLPGRICDSRALCIEVIFTKRAMTKERRNVRIYFS